MGNLTQHALMVLNLAAALVLAPSKLGSPPRSTALRLRRIGRSVAAGGRPVVLRQPPQLHSPVNLEFSVQLHATV